MQASQDSFTRMKLFVWVLIGVGGLFLFNQNLNNPSIFSLWVFYFSIGVGLAASYQLSVVYLILYGLFVTGGIRQVEAFLDVSIATYPNLSLDIFIGHGLGLLLAIGWNKSVNSLKNIKIGGFLVFGFLIFQILSAMFGVVQNLIQTGSMTTPAGILWHIINIRSLGWHEDFFPLTRVAVGIAALLSVHNFLYFSRYEKNFFKFVEKTLIFTGVIFALYAIFIKSTQLGFTSVWKRGIHGVFPDIHSFASLYCGVILLIVHKIYLYLSANDYKNLPYMFLSLFLSLYAIILSQSKSSIWLLIFFILIYVALRTILSKRFGLLKKSGIVVFSFALVGLFFYEAYLLNPAIFRSVRHLFFYMTEANLNKVTAARPEIYAAAWTLFSLKPIFGIGTSLFFRNSSFFDIAGSLNLANRGGENAHNYFLQVLAENGLVGFILFVSLVLLLISSRSRGGSLRYFLFGILLTNIFAHSLLVDAFYILFFSLSMTCLAGVEWPKFKLLTEKFISRRGVSSVLVFLMIGLVVSAMNPVGGASYLCHKENKLQSSFTGGSFAVGFSEVTAHRTPQVKVRLHHGYVKYFPVTITTKLLDHNGILLGDSMVAKVVDNNEFDLFSHLSGSELAKASKAEVRLSRCFVPKNQRFSQDRRVLGLEVLTQKYVNF